MASEIRDQCSHGPEVARLEGIPRDLKELLLEYINRSIESARSVDATTGDRPSNVRPMRRRI